MSVITPAPSPGPVPPKLRPPKDSPRRAPQIAARRAAVKAAWLRRALAVAAVVAAVLATVAVTAGPIRAAGANPAAAYKRYLFVPLGSFNGVVEVLIAATPLLFTGLAVAIAFKAGFYNIGGEGQFLVGAVGATAVALSLPDAPRPVALTTALLVGAACGVAWMVIPAYLRTRFGIDEVVTTLLLNPVALLVVQGLLNGPWRNPKTGFANTVEFSASYALPRLFGTRVHAGLLIAVVLVVITGVVVSTTATGLRLKAVGQAPGAALASGIDVKGYQLKAALVSGGVAGLGGAVQVTGVSHQLTEAISHSYGYTGIVVATLGALSAIGVTLVALLLGLIGIGAEKAAVSLHLPSYMGDIMSATLLLTVVAALVIRFWRPRWWKRVVAR
ncbi:MAG: ABC transporter permease, partial [Bifidobacteriaceae bacterium]|nr:ABC transporter permease [Bifidobacteriaceae bacterium]